MMTFLMVVLAFLWGRTVASISSCCSECPNNNRVYYVNPGTLYSIDCFIQGRCEHTYYLNNVTLNATDNKNNDIYTQSCSLYIRSFSSQYEGAYSCSLEGKYQFVKCVYVLAAEVPKFEGCSGNVCNRTETVLEGHSHSLDFRIMYENEGCNIVNIHLNLTGPNNATPVSLQPGDYSYNCSTKIRHVQKTLTNVSQDDQGLYSVTIFSSDAQTIRRLNIYLTVNETTSPSVNSTTSHQTSNILYQTTHQTTSKVNSSIAPQNMTIPTSPSTEKIDQKIAESLITFVFLSIGLIVLAVAGLVTVLVCCQVKRNKNPVTTPSESVVAVTAPDHSRKSSDSTSGGSSAVPTFNLSIDSVVTLERSETVHPPQAFMKVGNGAPEEETRRQQGKVAMERGLDSPFRSVSEGPEVNSISEDFHADLDGWTYGAIHNHSQHSSRTCSSQYPVAHLERDPPPHKHLVHEVRQVCPDQDPPVGHHHKDQTTWEVPADHSNWTPLRSSTSERNVPENRYPAHAPSEDGNGTLRLVRRLDHNQEYHEFKDYPYHSTNTESCSCRRTGSNNSNRTSIISSPGDGRVCLINCYFSPAQNV